MPWYLCSNNYAWSNIVKAKNHREAKLLYYKYGDEPGEWINIRCRQLKKGEYNRRWLRKYLESNGVISRPPSCDRCGSWFLKPEELKECPVCKTHEDSHPEGISLEVSS